MNDLIEALLIFAKYTDKDIISPTACEHDVLYVMVDPAVVSGEDLAQLAELSFRPNDVGTFTSYRFGSA